MLRIAMDVPTRDRIRNEGQYGKLPKVTDKINERRLGLAGHCNRHSELEVCNMILWEPSQGRSSRGSSRLTYMEQLKKDTGLETSGEFLPTLLLNLPGIDIHCSPNAQRLKTS